MRASTILTLRKWEKNFSKIVVRKKRILYAKALTLLVATNVRTVSITNGLINKDKIKEVIGTHSWYK